MTTDTLLHGDDAEDLLGLPDRVLQARLTSTEWGDVVAALTRLRSVLSGGSNREVLRAAGVFDDLMPVRVRAEPGTLPVESPSDDVAHLVYELDVAIRERLAETVSGARTDNR